VITYIFAAELAKNVFYRLVRLPWINSLRLLTKIWKARRIITPHDGNNKIILERIALTNSRDTTPIRPAANQGLFPRTPRNQRRRWWTLVKSRMWIGYYLRRHQACLSGHFKLRQGCLAAKNRTPRVTSLPTPAIVGHHLQPTLHRPPPTPFSFRQARLTCQVPARLLGTILMVAHIWHACQVLCATVGASGLWATKLTFVTLHSS
jgi:hypothetical protein